MTPSERQAVILKLHEIHNKLLQIMEDIDNTIVELMEEEGDDE